MRRIWNPKSLLPLACLAAVGLALSPAVDAAPKKKQTVPSTTKPYKKKINPATKRKKTGHAKAGDRLPADSSAKTFTAVGQAVALLTDAAGQLKAVTMLNENVTRVYSGCGLKLADVPHLVAAYDSPRMVALHIDDQCITEITTSYKLTSKVPWAKL